MSHYRTLTINGQPVAIKHSDYDYAQGNEPTGRFNLTLQLELAGVLYPVCFSNVTMENGTLEYHNDLRPCGDEYARFLQALETDPYYRKAGQYRDIVAEEARKNLCGVAEAIFLDVRSHSPDQDEE